MDRAAWRAQPAATPLACDGGCAAAIADAVAAGRRLIAAQGDVVLDGPLELGSPERPIVLLVTGGAAPARRGRAARRRRRRRARVARRSGEHRRARSRRGPGRRRLPGRRRRRHRPRRDGARPAAARHRQLRPRQRQLEGLLTMARASSPSFDTARRRPVRVAGRVLRPRRGEPDRGAAAGRAQVARRPGATALGGGPPRRARARVAARLVVGRGRIRRHGVCRHRRRRERDRCGGRPARPTPTSASSAASTTPPSPAPRRRRSRWNGPTAAARRSGSSSTA